MPNETVTINVTDQQVPAVAVDGVLVQVYDSTGAVLQTSATTGVAPAAAGQVQVVLNGTDAGVTYQLRFFQTGTSFTQPTNIAVTSPPDPSNTFDNTAQTHTLPVATDSNYCRCSGTFVDGAGQVIEGLRIFFINSMDPPDPQIVGAGITARAVLGSKTEVISDSDGYVQVDLIRDAEYDVIISGQENVTGKAVIPNATAVNIIHVLYPVISDITYDPVSPLAMVAGATQDVTLTITFSSAVTKFAGAPPLEFTSDDTAIATAALAGSDSTDSVLTVTAVAAGSATLTPTRTWASDNQEIIARPVLVALPTIAVTVT